MAKITLGFLLVFVLFFHFGLCSDDDHGHEHHGTLSEKNIIEEIKEALNITDNSTTLTKNEIQSLMVNTGFKNCSVTDSKCSLCTPLDVVLTHQGLNTSKNTILDSEQVLGVLSSLVYLLSAKSVQAYVSNNSSVGSGAVCNTSLVSFPLADNASTAFHGVIKQHGGGQATNKLTEKELDSVLETINETIGYRLTNSECFDVDDVFKGTNVSESDVDQHSFELISAFIVLKVLKKNCISEHGHATGTTLPAKTTFIGSLFTEYGENGTMSLDNFEKLLKAVGVGVEPAATTSTDSHAGHNHRKRRSLTEETGDTNVELTERSGRQRRAATSSIASTCYTPESLLKIYSIDQTKGLSAVQFTELCPSIVQQIESGACKTTSTTAAKRSENGWKPWVSAIVSVLLISLISLVGIAVAPINNKSRFKLLLTFFIALATSTLLGDGLLHLLPHSLNLHKHEESGTGTHASHDPFATDSYVWKCLLVIAGIYLFYLFEIVMHSFSADHGHSHGLQETHQHVARVPSHKKASGPLELTSYKSQPNGRRISYVNSPAGLHTCESEQDLERNHGQAAIDNSGSTASVLPTEQEKLSGWKKRLHKFGQFKAVVYMILIGDAIHNFMDGIVIGVAFSEKFPAGFSGGISTSIAIFCHEVPHELGDFAVLVSSGMSIPMALFLNFVSSLTSIIGAIVGVSLGQEFEALPWVFAITAGLFIYIALTDLLPELLHSSELRHSPFQTFLLQSFGLFLGFTIMFLLAVYEEDIKVDV